MNIFQEYTRMQTDYILKLLLLLQPNCVHYECDRNQNLDTYIYN